LVGTKIDLRDDPGTRAALTKQHMEPVKYENVLNYVKDVNKANKIIYKYIECSALTQRNLKSVFDEAIR
jgi:Ras-related C3 botulinum toxin substrate 1